MFQNSYSDLKRYLSVIMMLGISMNASAENNKKEGYKLVESYVENNQAYTDVLSNEGEYIAVFNDEVIPWIKSPLTKKSLVDIQKKLEKPLHIELNDNNFAPAATRTKEGEDDTNYDAIWVRDNVWVFYALKSNAKRKQDSKQLLLALWDYYATDIQIKRFETIINKPSLAVDPMEMPHIRFDGSSDDLRDVYVDNKPQVWNHSQIDAHGLFFSALGESFKDGLLSPQDLTENRAKVLLLYPLFLQAIQFYQYEDSGAWEEITRKNTSSIGLATRSLQVWADLLHDKSAVVNKHLKIQIDKSTAKIKKVWRKTSLDTLIDHGLSTVKTQLAMGGESPDYPPNDVHYRRADAALLHLLTPSPLQGLSLQEQRQIMLYVETLKRPFGILRYVNDSYQGGNYWIKPAVGDGPSLTGDTSTQAAFEWRLSQLEANTEAQWFFDSLIALAWINIAKQTSATDLKSKDIHLAKIHIKRALGQISDDNQIAADGKPIQTWMAPESINTVTVDGNKHYLASPITPLNWAKASLSMALEQYAQLD